MLGMSVFFAVIGFVCVFCLRIGLSLYASELRCALGFFLLNLRRVMKREREKKKNTQETGQL